MFMPVRLGIAAAAWCCFALAALAGEPKSAQPEPEKLPPPKEGPPPVIVYFPPPMPRLDTRAGWSYFGVDQTGRYRPRVILSPYGSYYLYSGERYPWTPQPRLVLPQTSD